MNSTGSTANIVLITQTHIYCANLGDARSVMSVNKKAVALSVDHKPNDEEEKARIVRAGGRVVNNRIKDKLAVSRAIGDYRFKTDDTEPEDQMVCAIAVV
jgi:protein phosphatase 2C family protein 2/3